MIDPGINSSIETTDGNDRKTGSLTADERETIIRISDGDDQVHIDTTRRSDITALRKRDAVTETGTGYHGTTEWATFTIPKARYSAARGVRTQRNLTPEQRQAMADRFRRHMQEGNLTSD